MLAKIVTAMKCSAGVLGSLGNTELLWGNSFSVKIYSLEVLKIPEDLPLSKVTGKHRDSALLEAG